MMLSPDMFLEEAQNYNRNELLKKKEEFTKYINDFKFGRLNKEEYLEKPTPETIVNNYKEYINIIDRLLAMPKAQNELILKKIYEFILFRDPREMQHYRKSDLDELSRYDDYKDLPKKFDIWVDMAIREIYEENKLSEIYFDASDIPHFDVDAVLNILDKAIEDKKNNEIISNDSNTLTSVENSTKNDNSEDSINSLINNIDNFLSESDERVKTTEQVGFDNNKRIKTPEQVKLENEQKHIENLRKLRNKVDSVIRLYTGTEMPHVDITRSNGKVNINYPEVIINFKDYMLNNSYFNKEYNLDIQSIMNKSISTLTADETFAYVYYILKAEDKQKGYMANMINSNVFNMLCTRLYNYSYDLI